MTPSVVAESSSAGTQPVSGKNRTPFEPIQEVRFAVVLFGGVSLAVYINGVVQELLHLVRASAPDPETVGGHPYALLDGELEGAPRNLKSSEKIYRKLAMQLPSGEVEGHKIRTRFVIDVISGTSAGGINGIFLAKALAHNLDLSRLAQLWEKEGDLDKLLDDKVSYEGLKLDRKDPASLLNSRRMTWKLLEAFQGMRHPDTEKDHPLTDELKLLTTATDLRGRLVLLNVGDRKVYERRHHQIFQFDMIPEKRIDHFTYEYDPFLTFAARATSSFPVAFEPATLGEVEKILELNHFSRYQGSEISGKWRGLYEDYRKSFAARQKDPDSTFRKVNFGDGGILDNKPFSNVVKSIGQRTGGIPVDRKLIYVEPSPEHPEDDSTDLEPPQVLENLFLAGLKLPAVETIREDLEQLEDYKNLALRAEVARQGQRDDISRGDFQGPEHFRIEYQEWKKADLQTMISRFGIGYGPYHRLKVAALMRQMAVLLTSCWGWEPGSEIETAIREVVKVWRAENYQIYRETDPDPTILTLELHRHRLKIEFGESGVEKKTENELVGELDLWWALRRLRHVREQLGEMVLNAESLRQTYVRLFPEIKGPQEPYSDGKMIQARNKASRLSLALGKIQSDIYGELKKIGHLSEGSFREPRPKELEKRLLAILRSDGTLRSLEEREGLAIKLLADPRVGQEIQSGIETLTESLKRLVTRIQTEPKKLLELATSPIDLHLDVWHDPVEVIEKIAAYHYRYFEPYDVAVYPLLYGTGGEEASAIDVIRISPEDADRLYDQRDLAKKKLAGDSLYHFGAFLDSAGRRNDRIWGRLDAAERILDSLVPDFEKRRQWREQLHQDILGEELGAGAEAAIGDILEKHGLEKEAHTKGEGKEEAAAKHFQHDPLAMWFHELGEKDRSALLQRMQALLSPQKLVDAFAARTKEREIAEWPLVSKHLPRILGIAEKVVGGLQAVKRSNKLRSLIRMLFRLARVRLYWEKKWVRASTFIILLGILALVILRLTRVI